MPTNHCSRLARGPRARTAAAAVATALATVEALANPSGASVQAGAAQLSNPSPGLLQVINTPGAIVNWQSFSIGNGETTRFVQLNAASAILNRVTGGDPSSILGRLESNGRVFLVNPNGIVFGGASVVDTAGLIASTRDIANADFLAGRYAFDGAGSGAITVQAGARITTAAQSPSGGQVWLFAKNVTTEAGSRIETPQGQAVLAAGSALVVGTDQLGGMQFNVETRPGDTVRAAGDIVARRGAVGFFADRVNLAGRVDARSDSGGQGTIVASASADIKVERGAVLDVSADAASAKAGRIDLDAAATLSVDPGAEVLAESPQGTGGTIRLGGYQVDLPAPSAGDAYGETNQNVRAFGSSASTDGRVTVEERGTFAYGFASQSVASASWTYQSSDPATQFPTGVQSNLSAASQAGDGAVLVARNDFNGISDAFSFNIVRDSGNLTGLALLPSNGAPVEIKGLARGGWAIAFVQWNGSAASSSLGVRIVDASGQVKATLTYGFFRQLSVVPLPSGAVWVREFADGSTTVESSSRVFSAAGVELAGADRAAALGGVRAVEPSRIARASASGPAFVQADPVFGTRREASGSAADGYYDDPSNAQYAYGSSTDTSTTTVSVALLRGSQVLTTLPDSVSSSSTTTTQSPGGWTVTGTETRTVPPPSLDTVRVLFKQDESTGTRTEARSETTYRPGQGLNGSSALVVRRTYSESRAETSSGSGEYTGIWISPAEAEFWQQTWIPSLNTYSQDGHFVPPTSASVQSGGTTYAYSYSDRYDLLRFVRTPNGAPAAQSSAGAVLGASTGLGTRPGLSNADPGFVPPPVVSGSGSGASFGGVSGCNAAVCSDEAIVARALSVVHSTQKAMDVAACAARPGGCSDAEKAGQAVRAVWEEHVRRTAARTGEQDAEEGRLAVRDFDKLNDLIGGLTRGIDAVSPDEARRRVDAAKAAVDAFVARERLTQELGLNPRSDPVDRALVDALVNMTDSQKESFVTAVVREQQIDPNFGAPAPTPAPPPQDPPAPLPRPEPSQPAGNEGNGENTIVERTEGPCTGGPEECGAPGFGQSASQSDTWVFVEPDPGGSTGPTFGSDATQ